MCTCVDLYACAGLWARVWVFVHLCGVMCMCVWACVHVCGLKLQTDSFPSHFPFA
uniref:Uncharacterized protein n=1 Tax=Anguilla anguilla TaxID=7936 RepID=A0A0E9W9Y8_ANGAN